MEVKVAICDDVAEVGIQLEKMLKIAFEKYAKKCEIDVFFSGEEFCEQFHPRKYDIVFLDIEFPGMNGIEVGRFIRDEREDEYTQIVYISGKTRYAMELFQFHPLDFLEKPVDFKEVKHIVETYWKIVQQDQRQFFYQVKNERKRIPLTDILYFESNRKVILIHEVDGTVESYYDTLEIVSEKIEGTQFLRIHKSFLVNFQHITSCKREYITLVNGEILAISQSKRKEVQEKYNSYILEVMGWPV